MLQPCACGWCCNTKTSASLVLSRTCACAPMHSCVTDACLLSLCDRAVAVFVFLACARTLRLATDSHDHFMAQVRSKRITHFHGSGAVRFNAQYPSVVMSVEQASHKMQEQLQRVSAGHEAMHQELTTLRSMVDRRSRVRLVEPQRPQCPTCSERKTALDGEEDLVVHNVPLIWYCSKFNNTDD